MRDVVASPDGVGSFHLLLASFYEREKKGKLEMAFFVFFLVNFSGERWKGGGVRNDFRLSLWTGGGGQGSDLSRPITIVVILGSIFIRFLSMIMIFCAPNETSVPTTFEPTSIDGWRVDRIEKCVRVDEITREEVVVFFWLIIYRFFVSAFPFGVAFSIRPLRACRRLSLELGGQRLRK